MQQDLILIVDDEPAIREMIHTTLTLTDFDCVCAADTTAALQLIHERMPALLLLDWMLPDNNGLAFTKRLRRNEYTQHLPIIMLTAKTTEDPKIQALNTGVDDYITKPFSRRELIARIQAVLRRARPFPRNAVLTADTLTLDTLSQRVSANQQPITMGPTEYRLLAFFMSHPERAYSRQQLLDHVWGNNVYVEDRTVDVHIRRLRKALTPSGHDHLIQTVRGTGYRFSTQGQ